MYLLMKRIITLLLLVISILGMAAQSPAANPVRWRTIIKTTGADSGIVTFKALVAQGWHLYGLDLPENGPKPTVFDFDGSVDIKFTGKLTPSRSAIESDDKMFGMTLSWWDSNVEFSIPFKVTGSSPKLHCTIYYMTCDGSTCLPPAQESIATPIKLNNK